MSKRTFRFLSVPRSHDRVTNSRAIVSLKNDYAINFFQFCDRFGLEGIDAADLLRYLDEAEQPYYELYVQFKQEGY